MNKSDFSKLVRRTREDGNRLFGVCELIHKIYNVFLIIIGGLGTIASLAAMSLSFPMGMAMAIVVAVICFFIYVIAVLLTHVAKVMVHNSFATLGLLEHFVGSTLENSSSGSDVESSDEVSTSTTPIVELPIYENDPIYIEGNKLIQFLGSHGYELVKFENSRKIWVIRGGSAEFECNFDQLKELAKNFK